MWDLVGNPEDRFSHDEAHLSLIKLDYAVTTCYKSLYYFLYHYMYLVPIHLFFCCLFVEGTEILILAFTSKTGQPVALNRHRIFLFRFSSQREDIF